MIEVVVGNNEVEIEHEKFHSFNDRNNLARMIKHLLDKAHYSGETLRLSVETEDGKFKELIDEW